MMKYIFDHKTQIKRKMNSGNPVLLLDFDLTLSPLAKDPNGAFLPPPTKKILIQLASKIPLAIVTGRVIKDVKDRVKIKNICYGGNHGLEYEVDNKYHPLILPKKIIKILKKIKKELLKVQKIYPRLVMEDKNLSLAVNYRSVDKKSVPGLLKELKKLDLKFAKSGLVFSTLNKKTFELLPKIHRDKGTICLTILKHLKNKKIIPIYIGDGQTDEDAFAALKKTGITIRVGKNNKSLAKWYMRDQREVKKFLKWLLSEI